MPRYTTTTYVDRRTLEGVVDGNYSKELGTEERALLDNVPEYLMPWFERAVVENFYLPLRGIMKKPAETLGRLVVELSPQPQGTQVQVQRKSTIRMGFGYKKECSKFSSRRNATAGKSFEESVEEALSDYRTGVVSAISVSLRDRDALFKYVPPNQVIESLRYRLFI